MNHNGNNFDKSSENGRKNSGKVNYKHQQNQSQQYKDKPIYEHKPINEDSLGKLIKDEANKVAKNVSTQTSYTQTRRFYDTLIQLQSKAKSLDNSKFQIEILPHVFLIKAQVKYAYGRSHSGEYFSEFISKNIDDITDKKSLDNFLLYFEAVLGFLKFHKEK